MAMIKGDRGVVFAENLLYALAKIINDIPSKAYVLRKIHDPYDYTFNITEDKEMETVYLYLGPELSLEKLREKFKGD